jgi:hypothetical protein
MPKVRELAGGKSTIIGKNKIINSKFDFWQRGTSINFSGGTYTADRWVYVSSADGGTLATGTITRQALSPTVFQDQEYYCRLNNTTQGSSLGVNSFHVFGQRIEDVKTFAGKTVTVSVWASSSIPGKKIALYGNQNFGSGGSADVAFPGSTITLTSTVTRYDLTVSIPSITGKTIGANNHIFFGFFLQSGATIAATYGLPAISWGGTGNIDIVRMMVTDVSYPVDFDTAGSSYADELRLCQRYYEKSYNLDTVPGTITPVGRFLVATEGDGLSNHYFSFRWIVPKRKSGANLSFYNAINGALNNLEATASNTANTAFIFNGNASAAIDGVYEHGFLAYTFTYGPYALGRVWGHYVVDAEI